MRHSSIIVASITVLSVLTGCSRLWPASSSSTNTNTVDPNIQPGAVAVIDSNIIIFEPASATTITSPVQVRGSIRSSDTMVGIAILDSQKNVVATSTAAIAPAANGGTFTASITYQRPLTATGSVVVFSPSAPDSENLEVPVVFKEFSAATVILYFGNTKKDPETLHCDQVYPLERKLEQPIQNFSELAALLIAGPTQAEKDAGFIGSLPTDAAFDGAQMKGRTLGVNFTEALQKGVAGSCRVAAIRAQITETFKQFGGIDDVVIAVGGKVEGVLQP